MKQIAILTTAAGALVMPARSPYERELLLDNAAFYAVRQGGASLQMCSSRRSLRVVRPQESAVCAHCARPVRTVAFEERGQTICRRCVAAA